MLYLFSFQLLTVASLAKAVGISLYVFKVLNDSMSFQWHSNTNVSNLVSCDVSYSVQDSIKWTVADHYKPTEKIIEIGSLIPNTTYSFFMVCYTKGKNKPRSIVQNFTTGKYHSSTKGEGNIKPIRIKIYLIGLF